MRFLKYTVGVTVGLFVLILIAGALAGSSSGDAKDSPPSATKPTKAAVSRCETVPPALVTQIAGFIKPETGAALRGARAFHTNEGGGMWFVAADLKGPGLDGADQIVVVPLKELHAGNGQLFGVGGFAHEFTNLRRGENSRYGFAITDDGAQEAQSCVKAALG